MRLILWTMKLISWWRADEDDGLRCHCGCCSNTKKLISTLIYSFQAAHVIFHQKAVLPVAFRDVSGCRWILVCQTGFICSQLWLDDDDDDVFFLSSITTCLCPLKAIRLKVLWEKQCRNTSYFHLHPSVVLCLPSTLPPLGQRSPMAALRVLCSPLQVRWGGKTELQCVGIGPVWIRKRQTNAHLASSL